MYATRLKMVISLILSSLLIGCANTMYFYETEKMSLTVEARPDSTQPVQGNLGLKQRVGLVVPKKKEDEDALSAISSFNFKITPEPETVFNPVLIQTAFITGEAAANLTTQAAAEAAQAITLNGIVTNEMHEHADCIIKSSTGQGTLDTLRDIVRHEFNRLSDEDWKKLKSTMQPCGVSDRQHYTLSLHKALKEKLID